MLTLNRPVGSAVRWCSHDGLCGLAAPGALARPSRRRAVTVSAVRAGTPILVSDLDEPGDIVVERWPTFMEGAAQAGVRAVFAFPLRIGAITVGVLDFYRDRPGDLTAGQLATALIAADAAALALLYLGSAATAHSPTTWTPARRTRCRSTRRPAW
jgi:GAF domain-containing protein